MTPAPALTEATMDKMTVEQIDKLKEGFAPGTVGELVAGFNAPLFLAALDLAKIALSPPQDVAALVEELQRSANLRLWSGGPKCAEAKAADALLSLSARNRGLEVGLKETPCPRPANSDPDDTTVGQCLELGHCGCTYAALLTSDSLCSDCPPPGYPTDETRCAPCPRRAANLQEPGEKVW